MTTTTPLFGPRTTLQEAFAALRKDLLHEDGPQISTMRNYRFAIVPYKPAEEYRLRAEVQRLHSELVAGGWVVLEISLKSLLLERIKAEGPEFSERIVAMEKRLPDRDRALKYLRERVTPLVEGGEGGVGGIADLCARQIRAFAEQNPDKADRTLALVSRAGTLYPFYRSSALLKHLAGKTANVPVVLLYPGERRGHTSLSFMGIFDADADYRPRIYP